MSGHKVQLCDECQNAIMKKRMVELCSRRRRHRSCPPATYPRSRVSASPLADFQCLRKRHGVLRWRGSILNDVLCPLEVKLEVSSESPRVDPLADEESDPIHDVEEFSLPGAPG